MKYLLTGGGTGGHVYPALAIAEEIRRQREGAQFLYVGRRDKLESGVVPAHNYPIRFVRASPFPRSGSPWALAKFMLTLWVGILQAVLILLRYRPQVIIGTGGYVSAPILFAYGALAKIGLVRAQVFLYEPNAHPGLLNQVVGRLAQRIGVAFEQAGRWFDMKRVAVVGYPVRRTFLQLDPQAARQQLDIPAAHKVVLVFGGSGGARVINEAVVAALPMWRDADDLTVLHVTGRYQGPDYDAITETSAALDAIGIGENDPWYRRYDYADQISDLVAAADLVICRGGAGTLTELGVSGTPALIVPLPTAAEDHQAINAREMERLGAAMILYQEAVWDRAHIHSRLDGEKMGRLVLELCADEERLRAMGQAARAIPQRNSLELIMDELDSLVVGQRPPPLSLEFPRASRGLPSDPNALLRRVQDRVAEVGSVKSLDECERAYLCYQADRLLASEGWYEIPLGRRNVGIKMVGVLQYWQHLPLLLQILGDRTSIGRVARFCGGDYIHAGILRRNAIEHGLRRLGAADAETEVALLAALASDPYFEVRAWAARALGEGFAVDDAIESGLCAALADAAPEVVIQALWALGKLGSRAELVACLRRFYLHANWQYRCGVVCALIEFLRRDVVEPAAVECDLDQILASTPYFKPEFTLNERLRELSDLVRVDATEGQDLIATAQR